MNWLSNILAVKEREIDRLRPQREELRRRALMRNDVRSFRSAIHRHEDQRVAIIAEVKKASPSAGVIAQSFDPVAIARNYERAGANGISVLTDEQFFQGKLAHLTAVRDAVALPVLRKDFLIDELQVMETVAAGADAILLIVAALAHEQLAALLDVAATYQLDALVEVHTAAELDTALNADAEIIGINNRDLTTFQIDLGTTERLSEQVPDDVWLVSESGIRSADDLARITASGVDAVLIGEALMRAQNGSVNDLLGQR